MERETVLKQFDQLTTWSDGNQRAPHKPLLVLYALGHYDRDNAAVIPFAEVSVDLTTLLKEFGPSRTSHHPEYPFWRLQNDGVWTVRADGELAVRKGNSDPKKSELLAHHARRVHARSSPPSTPIPHSRPRSPPASSTATFPRPSTRTSSPPSVSNSNP